MLKLGEALTSWSISGRILYKNKNRKENIFAIISTECKSRSLKASDFLEVFLA